MTPRIQMKGSGKDRKEDWRHVSTREPWPACASLGELGDTASTLWHHCRHTELAPDARSRPDGRRAGLRFLLACRSSHGKSRLLDDLSGFGSGDADYSARDPRE